MVKGAPGEARTNVTCTMTARQRHAHMPQSTSRGPPGVGVEASQAIEASQTSSVHRGDMSRLSHALTTTRSGLPGPDAH
ncbi:hypothetical protein CH63R_08198 [Colletotrichum higginsianum IMI 349063]|uniref:Uncharacterized protein n=1 Tax=Colletotrichum higginsianum (strain IMI 349063) TaxID=759273 RepID=A0A1B7YBF7_COLHI|nr:hypothetical protein CH63R_08198 [Colletotrichum higginsianum IMI 349063]OBR09433.1 hypothetical protein CH63R_08198 [Colletotrichum higginsianum IMI 349063]GJC96495.1 hypothetical protein ColKHC_05321 [Colletotrichum higginsianum]